MRLKHELDVQVHIFNENVFDFIQMRVAISPTRRTMFPINEKFGGPSAPASPNLPMLT